MTAGEFEPSEDLRLLKNPRFRRLLESRLVGQTGYNAMLYALFILVVKDAGSSVYSTLLVVALTVPSIVFGIPAGAIADMLPRRFTLTASYLARGIVVAFLVFNTDDLFAVFVLAVVLSTIGQFLGAAEPAVVPVLVRREQLPAANALMILILMFGQILGMVAISPLLMKLIGPEAVFVVAALLFFAASYIIGWMTSGFTGEEEKRTHAIGFWQAMRQGFDILRTNRMAYLSIVYLITSFSLLKVLVILMPKYTEDVLDIAAEDTVFVAAPAAIGAAVGLLLTPLFARLFSAWRVVIFGFSLFLLGLLGLGLVVYVRDFIQTNLDLGVSFVEEEVGVSSVITVAMLLAIPIGFAFSLVSVSARVVLNEQAPPETQGRVFAAQTALGDLLSLAPLFVVGIAADVVGVRATLLASAMAAILATGYLTFSRRFGPPRGERAGGMEMAPETGST